MPRMKRVPFLAVLLALAGTASVVPAQTACVSGPPAPPTYAAFATPPSFVSILGSPTAIVLHGPAVDDSLSPLTPLPIAFSFMGIPRVGFAVDSNGTVRFAAGASDFTNDPIPAVAIPNDYIAAWWDDLHTGAAGTVLYDVVAGSLVIEWNGVQHYPSNASGENATFQVVLNPSPLDTIDFHYDGATFTAGADPWTATIGVEDPAGAAGLDATGFGAGNVAFPATDVTLVPSPPGPPGPPILNYVASPIAPSFSSILGSPSAVVLHGVGADDVLSPAAALPIPFSFYGVPMAVFRVDTNGPVSFGAVAASDFTNDPIPAVATPNEFTAAWWDDLHTGPIGSVLYDVVGGSLVIEWNAVQHFPSNASGELATFQVVLNPSPADTIEFHYDTSTFTSGTDLWNATIGAESATGTVGLDVTGLGAANSVFPATDFVLDLCTACGSTESFGAPCPSTVGTAGGPPVGGNLAFAITQAGAAPTVPSLLILGFSNTTWVLPPALPLPLPLGIFGVAGGCSLLVSPDVLIGTFTTAVGTSAVPIPIPPGVTPCAGVYAEWANVTSFAPLTILTSDGMLVVTL
jgi:hypothetical protein